MSGDPRRDPVEPADAEAWRRAYRVGLPAGSAQCPAEEELVSLVAGHLAAEERLRLADHLVGCQRCTQAYRALAELDREAAAEASRGGVVGAVNPPRRRLVGWAAAAVLAAAAGLALLQLSRVEPPAREVVRGGGEAAVRIHPSHGVRLAEPPGRLSWTGDEAGAIYRVVLYDVEATPLWRSGPTTATRVELPDPVRRRLARGGTFYWRVRAEGEGGRSGSRLHRFEVTR
jgi:hypothetical protein